MPARSPASPRPTSTAVIPSGRSIHRTPSTTSLQLARTTTFAAARQIRAATSATARTGGPQATKRLRRPIRSADTVRVIYLGRTRSSREAVSTGARQSRSHRGATQSASPVPPVSYGIVATSIHSSTCVDTSSPWQKSRCIRPTLNPARICAGPCLPGVEYCRYSPSSCLVRRAQRRSRCDAGLSPRTARPFCRGNIQISESRIQINESRHGVQPSRGPASRTNSHVRRKPVSDVAPTVVGAV